MAEASAPTTKRSAALGVTETAGGNETWGVPQQNLGQVISYPT